MTKIFSIKLDLIGNVCGQVKPCPYLKNLHSIRNLNS